MVNRQEQAEMVDFVSSVLAKNGYKTQRQNNGVEIEYDGKYFIFCLGNYKPTKENLTNEFKKFNRNAVIFYNNNEDFMKKDDRAEQRYSLLEKNKPEEIENVIKLKQLEQMILEYTAYLPAEYMKYGLQLTYYQPKNTGIESIMTYKMKSAKLNYEHLSKSNNGFEFAQPGPSKILKIPIEKKEMKITDKAKIITIPGKRIFTLIPQPQ